MKLNLQINPADCQSVSCSGCKSNHFEQVFEIRRASPLQTGTSKGVIIPVQRFRCADCKKVLNFDEAEKREKEEKTS